MPDVAGTTRPDDAVPARLERARPRRAAGGGSPLRAQLRWFIRLRWIAAAAVLAGSMLNLEALGWSASTHRLAAVGGFILLYNVVLLVLLRSLRPRRGGLMAVAWAQILLDLACLTLLTLYTGAADSPLLGFYVFHMVFASLLLPQPMAFGGATAAMLMLSAALWLSGRWPAERGGLVLLLGWAMTLLGTVYLATHITRYLRIQRRRLMRQNRQIRAMSRRLRQHQQAMNQQEKMVALGQMAAGVAHEVANPLASMDSLLQLIGRKPERLRPETVQTLRDQIQRINQIVRQMTAFAHPAEQQWETLPLHQVVQGALDVIRFDPRFRRVTLATEYSLAAGAVRLLPHAIHQVVVNLVLNALDAMEQSPQPQLLVRTDRSEGWAFIEVIDNGHGIAPQHLDRLFEPFFTTKPVGRGTGLGLAISYSLVRQQSGRIEVSSRPGQGATFRVLLPSGTVGGSGAASQAQENGAGACAIPEK